MPAGDSWQRWVERSLSTRGAVMVAAVAMLGARIARPFPVIVALPFVLLTLVGRRPVLFGVGVLLLASSVASRSHDGLRPPALGPWIGWVTVLRDPVAVGAGLRVEVRVMNKHVLATAHGPPSWQLERFRAGDRVHIRGSLAALRQPVPGWMLARHFAARLTIAEVRGHAPPSMVARATNTVRSVLLRGAGRMPRTERSLFAGFILGDSREQAAEVADDFRASGLSHLLVVSGQNVAFVLTVARPGLERLRLRARLVATLGVLCAFGLLTRWEPSVLRATAMAGLAVAARSWGRQVSPLRVLALAVAALVLIDPMLVHSLGFALSVGASAGIAVAARPLEQVLPGPRWLGEPMAVAIAAHVGTAPFLLGALGGVPVVALAANLVAVPAAEPVMVWGLVAGVPAGLLAGVFGGRIAWLLHLPTQALISWIAFVARHAAQLPLGVIDGRFAWVLGGTIAASVYLGHRYQLRAQRIVAFAGIVLLAGPSIRALGSPAVDAKAIGGGATLWREGPSIGGRSAVIVLDGTIDAERVLAALRRRCMAVVDVVVVARGGAATGREVRQLLARLRVGRVIVPADGRIGGLPGRVTSVRGSPVNIRAGPYDLRVGTASARTGVARLDVSVTRTTQKRGQNWSSGAAGLRR